MTLIRTKVRKFFSTANRWRKSKGLTLALLVVILAILQPYVEELNNSNLTLVIGLAIGIVRFLTTASLKDK